MPHVSTVNQRTLVPAVNNGFVATTGNLGKYWYKTVADLFADALSTRPGDTMFLKLTNRAPDGGSSDLDEYLSHVRFDEHPPFSSTANGYVGVFEVVGRPFFDTSDVGTDPTVPGSIPVRVPIKCQEYLPEPVPEPDALDNPANDVELWNLRFKKTLQGGAKSLTSMTPVEGDFLKKLLHQQNDIAYDVDEASYPGDDSATISINDRLSQSEESDHTLDEQPDSIEDVSLSEIPITQDSRFRVEKTLEAWLMEMIDTDHSGIREVFGPRSELEWFTNYVPHGIAGDNMDGLAFHERDGHRRRVSVIELKRDRAKEDAVKQVMEYGQWVTDYLAGGDSRIVQPVLIAHRFSEDAIQMARQQIRLSPILATYSVEDGRCNIEIETGR